MQTLLEWMVSNALTASLLAVAALWVSYRFPRQPALAHACWLLVLIKLITPPLYTFTVINITVHSNPTETAPPLEQAPERSVAALPPPAAPLDSDPVEAGELQELIDWYESTWTVEPDSSAVPMISKKAGTPIPQPAPTAQPAPVAEPSSAPASPSLAVARFQAVSAWLAACWLPCLLAISLTGSAFILLRTLLRLAMFRRLLRLAEPANENVVHEVERLGTRLGLKQLPDVYIVPAPVGPLLGHAGGRAVIVLPAGLLIDISSEELRTVLAHELTHYRRGDHLWRYLELAAVALYWWLPSAWLASRRLRQAEEECCDAGVIASLPELAGSYATALVRSLSFVTGTGSPCPALTSGLGPVTLLKRRLVMMRQQVERRLGLRGWLMLLAVAGVALPVGFSMAQEPPEQSDPLTRRRQELQERERRIEAQERRLEAQERMRRDEPVRAQGRRATDEEDDDTPRPRRAPGARGQGQPALPPGGGGMTGTLPPGLPGPGMSGGLSGGMSGGMVGGLTTNDDMRSTAEFAVKQAELGVKISHVKLESAQNAVDVYRKALERSRRSAGSGASSRADVEMDEARLRQAETEVKLARLEIEQAELNLQQAKRRTSTVGRLGGTPSSNAPFARSGQGNPPAGFSGQGVGGGSDGFGRMPGDGQNMPRSGFAPGAGGGFGGGGPGSGFGGRGAGGSGTATTPAAPPSPPFAQGGVRGRSSGQGSGDPVQPPPAPPRAVTPPASSAAPAATAPPTRPTPSPSVTTRPSRRDDTESDSRDDRVRALERELREMRRALDEMKRSKKDGDN